jgi:hypothetical protein
VRYGLLLAMLMLASAQAGAQIILPPGVEPPTTLAQPPAGYPPTTATSAAGPYLAAPSWDQKLTPNVRFIVLTNLSSDAVLDRETGLVWSRQTVGAAVPWDEHHTAHQRCLNLNIGGRGGWRLPSPDELLSLIEFSVPAAPSQVRLPAGHPFVLASAAYWTNESFREEAFNNALLTRIVSLQSGVAHIMLGGEEAFIQCVRGRR